MRQTTVIYMCDRCGAERTFDGETMSTDEVMKDLVSDGWCIVGIKPIVGLITSIERQLCHVCVNLISDHLDKQTPVP